MSKFIVIENIDNRRIEPVLFDGIPHPDDETLKMWAGDVIRERFYGDPIRYEHTKKPLTKTDPDEVVVSIIGGERYKITMETLKHYLARLIERKTHNEHR